MISISSLTGSGSTNSIYGSRNSNIISGLASGLDTESMIEGLVQSYQQKITGLQQDRTKLEWKQEAYQSVSDKLVEFYRNYMSYAYSSTTNLASSSFFTNAVQTTPAGEFAGLVSASGKSNSTIVLNAVAQLADAARYTASLDRTALNTGVTVEGNRLQAAGTSINQKTDVSNLEGSITLTYGNKEFTVDPGALELYGANDDGTGTIDAEKLRDAIEDKLSNHVVTIGQTTYFANEVIQVDVKDGQVTFSDQLNAGNKVEVTGLTGKLADHATVLPENSNNAGFSFKDPDMEASTSVDTMDYLTGKTLEVTLDGKTKTITLGASLREGEKLTADNFLNVLNQDLEDAFGAGKIQVGATNSSIYDGLTFSVAEGSSLSVTSGAGAALGLGDTGLTTYLNTSRTLGDLLGNKLTGLHGEDIRIDYEPILVSGAAGSPDAVYEDADGNRVDQDGYLINEDGSHKQQYDLVINGKSVGKFTEDTALETVMNRINSSDAGVKVQYSRTTNEFVFTAVETGEGGRVEIQENTLGAMLFGAVDPDSADSSVYTVGKDAVFQVEVNGKTMNLARSSNSVEIDGMTLNLKGTFNIGQTDGKPIKSSELKDALFDSNGESVSFSTSTNADTVVDAVKQMVEDYNDLLKTVKDLYTTQPLKNTSNQSYEPLTDDDLDGMTETEIQNYEEKAKTGILYMDRDLSSLYDSLRNVLTSNSGLLKSVGLSTSYSDGLATLTLDEQALRQALESDPDVVERAFTQSQESGAQSNGIMAAMNRVVDNYAATTGSTKGILIEKAGSKYSPTAALDNAMLDQMDELDKQIEKWQDKLSDRVDYYTNQFTQLEMLIQQMNSQSSTLAGLMGGY